MDSTKVKTGDDVLTLLASLKRENWYYALLVYPVRILREAADLCGIDSTDMSKKSAANAIIENF